MNYRNRHQPGQSIVLLALMLVVIIGMVGLSVDAGNAYAEQRRMQSAANAGALAGMHAIQVNPNITNTQVWRAVQLALKGNKVDPEDPKHRYRADYLLADGKAVLLGEWNGSQEVIINGNGSPPSQIERLQVTLGERVGTYFARVVGQDTLAVSANGVACVAQFGMGVLAGGVPINLRPPSGNIPGHQVFLPDGTELSPSDPRWGNWAQMQGMTVRIPLKNKSVKESAGESAFVPGVHMPWLSWGGHDQTVDGVFYKSSGGGASELAAGWTYPGSLQNGFLEGLAFDGTNVMPMQKLQMGDWIAGESGANSKLKAPLDVLKANQHEFMLPFFDMVGSDGSAKLSVRTRNMGSFKLRDFALTGSNKFIELEILGDAQPSVQGCASEGSAGWQSTDGTAFTKTYQIGGTAKVNQVWRELVTNGATHDIVLVVDTSEAMQYDWENKAASQPGRIEDAKSVVKNFVRQLDISQETGDPDARIALVTFSGSLDESNLNVTTQANWAKACSDEALLANNNCGGEDNKWTLLQTKAGQLQPSGKSPGPIAFETVEQLLQSQRTPPAGKLYRQIVLVVSSSVFNVCGREAGEQACSYQYLVPIDGSLGGNKQNYYENAQYNMVSGRPIWQAQQVASRIRSSGAQIYLVALTPPCTSTNTYCFDPAGTSDLSSGSGYAYQAATGAEVATIFSQIRQTIEAQAREQTTAATCVPHESWQPAQGVALTLMQPENPTWSKQTTTDSTGAYQFDGLAAGHYVLKAEPLTLTSSDGHTYTYSRVRNGYNLSEEGQGSVYIDPQYPDGASVPSEIWLSLPYGEDGMPLNACTAP